jgi:hypothetical protein
MTTALLVLLAALVGGFAGGMASHLARTRGVAGFGGSRGGGRSGGGGRFQAVPSEADDGSLVRADLVRLQKAVERVHEEVVELSVSIRNQRRQGQEQRGGMGDAPNIQRTAFGAGPRRPEPSPAGPRGPESGRARDLPARQPGGGYPPAGSREFDPSPRSTGGDAWFDEPGTTPRPASHPLGDALEAYNPAPAMASAPPNAVSVEARDDRIVSSASYPPEAWLEPKGPATGHLWLNPGVALNENALRRLSTFFEWQGERAGLTYDTLEPAVVRWDEGQRIGTVSQRGRARPR